ncbi:MAG: hypothetical protein ABIS86_17610 [Streptosporangiaceae bacterium]
MTAVLLAAAAVFFVVPVVGGSGLAVSPSRQPSPIRPAEPAPTGTPTTQTPTPQESATETPTAPTQGPRSATAAAGDALETVPGTCSTVPEEVFLKVVPKGTREEYGSARGGSCGYQSPAGATFRYVRLETRIASAVNTIDPIGEAKWAFVQDKQFQQKDTSSTTRRFGTVAGLGEEAFQRFMVDKGDERTVTSRVQSRVRNVIVTVSFSQHYTKEPDKLLTADLQTAATVVKEALKKFS